jgi:beta-phosphoglucomutase
MHTLYMAQMFGAYLVDFDGTLADTRDANFSAYAAALQEVGVAVDRSVFDTVAFGRNWREFLPVFLQRAPMPVEPAAVAARKVALYPGFAAKIRFNEPLIALLKHSQGSVRVALVTSASRANVTPILQNHPVLRGLFEVIVTGDDVVHHKPHPESYELAARLLGVQAHQTLVIEDSEVGVAAGRAFGAQVLRVSEHF